MLFARKGQERVTGRWARMILGWGIWQCCNAMTFSYLILHHRCLVRLALRI
jgi:hypothetical protein